METKKATTTTDSQPMTVHDLIQKFMQYAERHYRKPSGRPTRHHLNFRHALAPLDELFGATPLADLIPNPPDRFGEATRMLKRIREHMEASGLCRQTINARLGRIRYVFSWAHGEEQYLPESVHNEMSLVKLLEAGRTNAPEGQGIVPVDERHVERTLPFLPPTIRDLVRVLMATGMRVSEARIMRRIDVDTSVDPWIYTPSEHKMQHKRQPRTIHLGPSAQAVMRFRLPLSLHDYVFAAPRSEGKRPYNVNSIYIAVQRAAERAGVPAWCPLQTRHTKATQLRSVVGLERARAAMGHTSINTTEIYAERDSRDSAELARRFG